MQICADRRRNIWKRPDLAAQQERRMVLEPGELSWSEGPGFYQKRSKFDQKTARTDGRNLEVHDYVFRTPLAISSSSWRKVCAPIGSLMGFLKWWWCSSRFMRPVARPAPPLRPRLEVRERWRPWKGGETKTQRWTFKNYSWVVGLLVMFTPNLGGRWIQFDEHIFLENNEKKSHDGLMGLGNVYLLNTY